MPDTRDAYEKTATVLLQHLLRGEPHFVLCLISQSGDCQNFGGCFDHATKKLTAMLRENIPHGIDAPFEDVKAFQKAFGHPIGVHPQLLDSKEKLRRIGWMNEELAELANAETVEDQADAIIDLMYFAFGYLVEMGVPPSGVWDAVHKANMAKLWPDGVHVNDVGKVVKPPEWEGPDGEIREYIGRIKDESAGDD